MKYTVTTMKKNAKNSSDFKFSTVRVVVEAIKPFGEIYFQLQNKWYPQSCFLVHFEAKLDFRRTKITCS